MRPQHRKTNICMIVLTGIFIFALAVAHPKTAQACCTCQAQASATSQSEWDDTKDKLENRIESEFTAQKIWIAQLFWEDNILPAMMLMTEQLTAVALQQMQIIGSFFDAQNQIDSQNLMRIKNAETHTDYHPSIGVCEFGTTMKSLAASERKSEVDAYIMSQRLQDRALGSGLSSATTGKTTDKRNRLSQFQNAYCDLNDNTSTQQNKSGMDYICSGGSGDKARRNKDIDFARTIDAPWTLDADFTDTDLTDDETDVLALASTLFSHDVFSRFPPQTLQSPAGENLSLSQEYLQNTRALQAKRSVAESSFNAIASSKMRGTAGSREYLLTVLKNMGLSDDEAKELLVGDSDKKIEPSYHAQMEILTKKAYQNPDFYTELYDTPANVDRKAVALQAINLVQRFDLLKSYHRREASNSILLEMDVEALQDKIETLVNRQNSNAQKVQ